MNNGQFLDGRIGELEQKFADLEDVANDALDIGVDNPLRSGLTGSPVLGEQRVFPGEDDAMDIDPFVAAWSVRIYAMVEKDEATQEEKVVHKREIFSPIWRTKSATHVAEGCAEGAWKDLPDDVKLGSGTLHAVLKITVAAATYEQIAWELKLVVDVSSLSDTPIVPPDPNATGGGSGTDGVYHLIVPIGRFVGSADDSGATGFEQWHVGVIDEDFYPRRTLSEQTVLESAELSEDGAKLLLTRKRVLVPLPHGKTPDPEEVELPTGGGEGLPGGTLVAWDVVEKTYSGSESDTAHPNGSIWLRQRWRVWRATQKAFVSVSEHPDTDICRLDTLGGSGGGWCVGAPKIVNEAGKLYEICYWWKVTAPTAEGQPPTYTETTFEARRIELLAHGSDHTEGVL